MKLEAFVDPIALGVVAAALLAKAVDRTGDELVGAGLTAAKSLLGWLKEQFSGEHSVVARVADAPDSPSRQRELAEEIARRAESDSAFAARLGQLVQKAQDAGFHAGEVSQSAVGSQNVQAANSSGVNVSYARSHADEDPSGTT